MVKKVVVSLLLTMVSGISVFAQFVDRPVLRDSIYSNILKETRMLDIVLPGEYSSAQASKTAVLYVTDAQWNTVIASNIEHFLEIQYIPQHIIVGIDASPKGKDNLRFRDMTPTRGLNDQTPVEKGGSGGGEAFLDFITKELMPYINQKYANNGRNILFGGSLGGLFGMYALLKQPQAFTGYLLADPSFWWNNYELQAMTREKLGSFPAGEKYLFIAGRSGQPLIGMGHVRVDSSLTEKAPSNLHWKAVAYTDETHNSMIFRTIYDGLKYIYWGYLAAQDLRLIPSKGFLLKDKPFALPVMNDNFSDIYYTTDGSVPTKASTPVTSDKIQVFAGTRLTLKAICNQEEYSKSVTGDFPLSDVFPAVALPKSARPGGLRYDYYLLKDSSDLAHAKPVSSGRADSAFQLGKLTDPEKYICVLSGFINVSDSGYYALVTNSWGASKVYLGKQLVIDQADAGHPDYAAVIVPLAQGFYPIRVEHALRKGEQKLELSYLSPKGIEHGENPDRIPSQSLYATGIK